VTPRGWRAGLVLLAVCLVVEIGVAAVLLEACSR
jgi:hypothetical protein